MNNRLSALRGSIFHFTDQALHQAPEDHYEFFDDGVLIIKDGHIEQLGPADQLLSQLPDDVVVTHEKEALIIPGMIDTHTHFPQTEMIASYGKQLLAWLDDYTYPTESQFGCPEHAQSIAEFFISQLIENGTTTAMVFAGSQTESVDAIFKSASAQGMRLISGKTLMDRNVPDSLAEGPEQAYQSSCQLIEQWHRKDRLLYAVSPRFAPSCSSQLLGIAGQLLKEYSDIYLQTHLSENIAEIDWVKALFPGCQSYLDVYRDFGLITPRSVLAHCLHLNHQELQQLSDNQSSIAFCPGSNLFLGSGLLKLADLMPYNINVGLGTDVGAGTSFSLLQTLSDAYKTQQLSGYSLSPLNAFYMTTLGGAKALGLEQLIGNFSPGKEADLIILNTKATPLIERRLSRCETFIEKLFVFMILGDDRAIKETYIMGKPVKKQC